MQTIDIKKDDLYIDDANRAESKSISVISILLLAAAGDITKLRCMHRECCIFASQNLCYYCIYIYIYSND